MGRKLVIRSEPLTSLSVNLIDSMLLDNERRSKESKADTLRRIFIQYFGEDKVREAKEELQKKLDRQALLHGETGDQNTIDNVYYPKRSYKDIEYERKELADIIIEAKQWKTNLAGRTADDSILRALERGDCKKTETGQYQIINRWF